MIVDASFVMRVRALEDIYSVLAAYSKAVQSTRALPWERQAGQDKVVDLLERMRLSLVALVKKTPSVSELVLVAEKEELWPSLLKDQPSPPVPEVCGKIFETLTVSVSGVTSACLALPGP